MKFRFLSIILSFFVLCSSFSLTVNATQVDDPHWVPVEEELLNELYMLVNSWGILFAPDVSLSDVISTSPTAGIGFRINPNSGVLEMDSLYRLRSNDGVTFPSEFIEGLKNIVKEYPHSKTADNSPVSYSVVDQIGYMEVKGYAHYDLSPVFDHNLYFSRKIDFSNSRVFGVENAKGSDGHFAIQFFSVSLSDYKVYSLYLPYESISHDKRDNTFSAPDNRNACSVSVDSYSFNIPFFLSQEEGIKWVKGETSISAKQNYLINYYSSSKFTQSVDNSVTITNDMLTKNYQEINNNYFNNVYNYVSNYNSENATTVDNSSLQAKIDEMQSSLDQMLEELQKPSGGGSGEGGSGECGSSSGDSTQDYSKDLEEIKTSLSDIYKKLEEFYEKYKNTVDSETEIDLSNIEKSLSDLDKLLTDFSQDNLQALQDMYKRLDDILLQLKNAPDQTDYSTNFDNIEQLLADIQLLLSSDSELYHSSLSHIEELLEENNKQNKNFFDKVLDKFDDIITYLKKIYRVNVVDTIADIVSAITDLFDFASLAQRSSETANLVKTKFPFCMPFDLFATLGVLSAPAVIPHFDLPFNFNIFGTQTENIISIDLTQYEKLATFSRDAFTVLFVVGLILLTLKIFNGGNDDD